MNYLIDEASDLGKGANTTISYVHYFCQKQGLSETRVHLHADNCSGQNKNNYQYFIWYLAWRAILQLHESINYSFLKFGTDCYFGMIIRAYKVNFVSSLNEFANMVDGSSTNGVKKAQLLGTHDGKIIVLAYNWSSFLGIYFIKWPNTKRHYHFRFSKDEPGKVYFKEFHTSPEQSRMLLKDHTILPPALMLPPTLNPMHPKPSHQNMWCKGLSVNLLPSKDMESLCQIVKLSLSSEEVLSFQKAVLCLVPHQMTKL